ncbi:MAG TPA: hypothetical protein VF641_08600 [Methylobacterium sp.]|jgi:hypothetical protein
MPAPPFRIRPARSAVDVEATAALFAAYADALGIDLAYQGFSAELASLRGAWHRSRLNCCVRARVPSRTQFRSV